MPIECRCDKGQPFKMPIKCRCEKGWPSNLESEYRRRVSRLVRGCKSYKIGITHDPKDRFNRPDYRVYDWMIVIYRTQSWKSAGKLEKRLIKYYKDDKEDPRIDNERAGGSGSSSEEPPYFLYVVIDDE